MTISPFISVIIPGHNEEMTIQECLDSLDKLNYPTEKLQLILIDDGSSDATGAIIKLFSSKFDIIYLETEGVGPSKARNIGLKLAKGDYVAFTDADCAVDTEWLNELLRGIDTLGADGVGGNQFIPNNATGFEKDVQSFLSAAYFLGEYIKDAKRIKKVKHNASCNSMYRKSIIEAVGGFNESLWPGEDVDLDYKITRKGYSLAFNPAAVVYHHRPRKTIAFFGMMKRYGWATAYLTGKYGLFRAVQYIPLLGLFCIILWIWLTVYYPLIGIILASAVIAGIIIWFIVKGGFKQIVRNCSLFIVALVGWGLGFISYWLGSK